MSGLTAEELRRIDDAEANLYECLYREAAATLGTGSKRIGDTLAIWYPREAEPGYNYLLNLHLASNLDRAYAEGLRVIQNAGASAIGIPVDQRVAAWATPEKIAELGLTYESDERIWARRIDPNETNVAVGPPRGFTFAEERPPEADLARWINRGWDLPGDHTRGALFACSVRISDWRLFVARRDREVAGITILVPGSGVGYLFLSVVMPEYRGHGLQTFFIRHRLAEAARAGCTLTISETNDPNASPRNLQRAGLQHIVTRRVYARQLNPKTRRGETSAE